MVTTDFADCPTSEDALADGAPAQSLIYEPGRRSWWPLLFLAIGLYLCVVLAVKVWNLYVVVHAFETTRGVVLDKNPANLVALAPDLQADRASTADGVGSASTLPHPRDVAAAGYGLLLGLLGASTLLRGRRRIVELPLAGRGRSGAFARARMDRIVQIAWRLAEILLAVCGTLLVVALSYQVVLTVLGGSSLSWYLVDRVITYDASFVLAVPR